MSGVSKRKTKVAVIGAGAAGLCAGRHLLADSESFEFDIYEQQEDVGGTWRYSENIGKDEHGLPVHSSMYKHLRTNLPKETMAFPDFPFHDCEQKSFIHHSEVLKYLQNYADHFRLKDIIHFKKIITNVFPIQMPSSPVEWSVTFEDVITRESSIMLYDAVMVCNGHYSVPLVPKVPGLESFQGIVMHSHDYREPSLFKGLKVVVLGAGASGIDISLEITSVAKEVILSHYKAFQKSPVPKNLKQEREITSVNAKSVCFSGNSEPYDCDAILLCTGYLYSYPFLDKACGVEIGDQRVSPLYMHFVLINYPSLAIYAVPKQILPFPLYDQQVKVFLKHLKGVIRLPSAAEMRESERQDFERRLEVGMRPRQAHVMPADVQWAYDDRLSELGEIEPIAQSVRTLFNHVHRTRDLDIVNYKNVNYKIIDKMSFEKILSE